MSKVLVVDDEKDVVDLLTFILQKDGHTVVQAYNGQQALDKVEEDIPDLMILDVMMPEVDGYTVMTRLNESDATRKIPIIILTAKGQMRDLFSMASNVAAYIEKAFDPKTLREKVNEILSSRAS